MLTYLPFAVILILFGIVACLRFMDKRKKRPAASLPPLSFIVPCYNDVDSVPKTIASIYEVCGAEVDVIVIDDRSTDGSREKLAELAIRFGFELILNHSNLGKSRTLNKNFHRAKNDTIIFVDADVIVNRQSLTDAVGRLQRWDVGAVSCPYRSANPGFIPLMQTIEYNMLAFIQGAYNVFSAISLWGGFIAVKRRAFSDVGGFTLNAITEDMDLAFKLNENGWRVEQSFMPIRTYVPDTLRRWVRQKIRWSSGGFQCFVKYHRVWLKNPLHILFIFSFCILLIFSTFNMGKNIFLLDNIIAYFDLLNHSRSIWLSFELTGMKFGFQILKEFSCRISFTLFSLPFVLPLASASKQLRLCLLIIPFSVFYVPAFSVISIFGVLFFLQKRRLLQSATRAW